MGTSPREGRTKMIHPWGSRNSEIGGSAEDAAVDFLLSSGYRIIARNYRTKCGEIDIVARKKGTYCFVEVKARASSRYGLPAEAVSKVKQRRISRTAMFFLQENNLLREKSRFDVVSIVYKDNLPHIELIENAFDLDESVGF